MIDWDSEKRVIVHLMRGRSTRAKIAICIGVHRETLRQYCRIHGIDMSPKPRRTWPTMRPGFVAFCDKFGRGHLEHPGSDRHAGLNRHMVATREQGPR